MVRPEPSGTHVAWVEAMTEHVVIIGGGLAGLSAGCYARASGFKTTIVEHNLALGGVCTAWNRGSYVIDGCIQWLTGGPFAKLYAELGILPKVGLHTIDEFFRYRDVKTGVEISLSRDLDRLAHELIAISLADADEILDWCFAAGARIVVLKLGKDGALYGTATERHRVAGHQVKAVDATGAGDCFGGALLARLTAGDTLARAVDYANAAAALTTLGFGAVAPIPRASEVTAFLQSTADACRT